ncbi:hypothetical protein HG530_008114 [Fusarium avenaceum]|nr:hypothetical protein HG530_008114 [Fusarium avenaceum]
MCISGFDLRLQVSNGLFRESLCLVGGLKSLVILEVVRTELVNLVLERLLRVAVGLAERLREGCNLLLLGGELSSGTIKACGKISIRSVGHCKLVTPLAKPPSPEEPFGANHGLNQGLHDPLYHAQPHAAISRALQESSFDTLEPIGKIPLSLEYRSPAFGQSLLKLMLCLLLTCHGRLKLLNNMRLIVQLLSEKGHFDSIVSNGINGSMESILQSLDATCLGEVGGTINEGRYPGQVLGNVVSKGQGLCDALNGRLLGGESAFERDVLDRGLSRRDSDPANLVPYSDEEE